MTRHAVRKCGTDSGKRADSGCAWPDKAVLEFARRCVMRVLPQTEPLLIRRASACLALCRCNYESRRVEHAHRPRDGRTRCSDTIS